jgi:hypothetical protein
MANPPHRLNDQPSWVEITVLVQRDRPATRERIVRLALGRRYGVVVVLAVVAVVISAAGAVVLRAGSGGARRMVIAGPRESGARGVAAAAGYPLRCLSVTIAGQDAGYARVDFNRAAPCGRYDGYATALFHRVDGSWRRVIDALGYSCPVAEVPRPVQAELAVCP